MICEKYANRWIPEPNTGCYIWVGSVNHKNFRPIAWRNGNNRGITRLICEEFNGPPPTPKHEAAHKRHCVGHLCVNGNHLYWATRKENESDKSDDTKSWAAYKASGSKLPMGIQNAGKWGFRVRIKRVSLGLFRTLEEAIEARNKYED